MMDDDDGTTGLSTWRDDSRQEVDHETSRSGLKKSGLRNRPADDSNNVYVHDNVGNAGSKHYQVYSCGLPVIAMCTKSTRAGYLLVDLEYDSLA